MNKLVIDLEDDLNKIIDNYNHSLLQISSGGITPQSISSLIIHTNDCDTKIENIANIAPSKSPGDRVIIISFWDKKNANLIMKAIANKWPEMKTSLSDDKSIKVYIPAMTQEFRLTIIKDIEKISESFKIKIRGKRKIYIDMVKKDTLSKDEQETTKSQIQDTIDKFSEKIDSITENKKKTISHI